MFKEIVSAFRASMAEAMSGNLGYAKGAAINRVEAARPNGVLAMMWVAVGAILALIVGSFLLYIGLFLNATVVNSLPVINDAAYNATLSGVKTNVNTGFTITGIIFIIIGAAGCIVVILSMVGAIGAKNR